MDVRERVATALACAALDRSLAGILLFDLDADLIVPVVRWFAGLVGGSPAISMLGATATDDDLWTRIRPRPGETNGFRLEHGPLVGADRPPGVVVVPDLALLGLAGARAAVATIGADVVHLERAGMRMRWRPADYWIACCRRAEVGRVSQHLLDRFAVRVDAAGLRKDVPARSAAEAEGLRAAGDRTAVLGEPDPQWRRAMGAGRLPGLSMAAAEGVVELVPPAAAGTRRDLALARIARALAALDDESVVEREHVDAAARLIGLSPTTRPDDPSGPERLIEPGAPWVPVEGGADHEAGHLDVPAGEGTPLPSGPLPDAETSGDPYPEDHADPEHDEYPLRVPWHRRAGGGPPRGHPIGTGPAREVRDIAMAATLLESAKFQTLRCGPDHFQAGHRLHVEAVDLRGHRRAPRPSRLLVLLLDHTCHHGWDWYGPLAPYLRWAYAARAPVDVVEVGAADASDELCAQRFAARGLLDPRVATALERRPGRATPLAHGLSLAARLLRRETQQGDAAVVEAVLVVVTDGRANVPLAASRAKSLPERVAREGVDDALGVAGEISALHRVRSVVVDPGPRPGSHLTTLLATALGGLIVPGGFHTLDRSNVLDDMEDMSGDAGGSG
ncbi:hypothetical protein ACOZ38_25745 [Sphaerisporangium viridialbum]|uniref:hypothetical protein n=1 Tax=Sphaerisporangium viridialbum TaxID=46189 RepID=UPI003C74CFB6